MGGLVLQMVEGGRDKGQDKKGSAVWLGAVNTAKSALAILVPPGTCRLFGVLAEDRDLT